MNIKYIQGMLIVFLYYISAGLFAQNLPQLHMKTLINQPLEFQLKAFLPPSDNLYGPVHGVINQLEEIGNDGPLTIYKVTYTPQLNFIGKDTVVIEYRGTPGNSIMNWHIKQVTVFIEVSNSIIEANKDIEYLTLNSLGDTIDILANDSTTGDSLFLDGIFNIKNCEANITPDNKLFVRPLSGYEGNAFVNYYISDEYGAKGIGHIMLIINGATQLQDTLVYYVTNTNTLSFTPGEGVFLMTEVEPALGELDLNSAPELIYTPFVDALGVDVFKLRQGNDTIAIKVNVVESELSNKLIADDKVFTPKQTPVSFNVSDNDFKKNSFITSFTQPEYGSVTHSGQGNFTYIPDQNFLGFDEFTYTRQLSFSQYQTATVEIVVNDFLPYNNAPYLINIPKNKEFVLNYDVPINGYTFEVYSQSEYGNVEIFEGIDTITVNCEEIAGKNMIVFTPENDYTGTTRFELKYCAPNNNCNIIKVDLNVLDTASNDPCYCASYTCIWEGDVDNNGLVNVKDLIPLGKFAGESGSTRDDDSNEWMGLNGDNWNPTSEFNKFDLKHADSNGDGFISELDSLNILSNYNRIHNLYFDGETEQTKFPIYITTEQDTVYAGEILYLFINAGDEEYVAKDVTAISYVIQIEPELVDSSSLHHSFYLNSWLAGTSASFQMSNQVFTGQVEAAFSKVGNTGVSGIGKVSKCDFIIEDDMIGIKRDNIKNNLYPVKIRLTNVNASTGNNSTFRLPDTETTVFLRLKDQKTNKTDLNLNIYPNPSSDEVQLYLDSNDLISSYRVFNVHGMLMENHKVDNQQQTVINTTRLKNGVYFIEVVTDKNNRVVRKIEVIK